MKGNHALLAQIRQRDDELTRLRASLAAAEEKLAEERKHADELAKYLRASRECCGGASDSARSTGEAVICINCPHLGAHLVLEAHAARRAAEKEEAR